MKRLIAVALTLLALPALADTSAPSWFQALDRDKDGVIGANELLHARYQRFARMDANRDGMLSPRELRRDRPWLSRFSWFDVNSDGRISIEEYEAKGLARFAKLDLDRDGRVTLAEAKAVMKAARDAQKTTTAG